jgi:hypothetical protein
MFAPLFLERRRTHDTAFEDWANLVWRAGQSNGTEMSLKKFQKGHPCGSERTSLWIRKNILVELCNEAGSVALVFRGYHCWPSEYIPLADLESTGDSSVTPESLTIQ